MSNLVIAVGGTGKSVALVYLKLAKFFGKPFDLVVQISSHLGGMGQNRKLTTPS